MNIKKTFKFVILFFGFLFYTMSQCYANDEDTIVIVSKNKDSYWNSLFNGHIDRTFEKRFDMSFVSAPSYTREASFGIGGMATALYRVDRTDSVMVPSNITMTFNASINGFYALTAEGNHNFKGRRSRLSYQIAFFNKNLNFWGITYDDCNVNLISSYRRQQYKVSLNYQYELFKNFYTGALLDFSLVHASKIDEISYLLGQKRTYTATGLGLSLQYDSRDFIPNPKQGMYILLRETVYPEMLGNTGRTLWRTTLITDFYQKVWEGGIIAFDLYGQISSNNLPWTMREELGGNRMRGYYTGQYIDNNIVSGQIELRQHVVKRLGASAWIGGGSVFPSLQEFDVKKILPNYGVGLRFEIKHNVNGRVDFGLGKQTGGFVFGMNEVF
ncbi:MAG: outer membrane protein assembly factor [Candidatus Azobacteroides sp.]|nr:outer membrane protein assembly factor [Candidatus Azobacteroides sp.]